MRRHKDKNTNIRNITTYREYSLLLVTPPSPTSHHQNRRQNHIRCAWYTQNVSLWRKLALKLLHSHHGKLAHIQMAKLHCTSSALHLMHCSVLQEPPYCFLFFRKRNSQVADLGARLQRYLLFEIMALGSSKSLKTETNDLFTPISQGRTKRGLSRAKKPAATGEGAACVPLQTTFCHHGDNKISCTHNSVPLSACMMADVQWV